MRGNFWRNYGNPGKIIKNLVTAENSKENQVVAKDGFSIEQGSENVIEAENSKESLHNMKDDLVTDTLTKNLVTAENSKENQSAVKDGSCIDAEIKIKKNQLSL